MKHETLKIAELLVDQCGEYAWTLIELAAKQALEKRDAAAHRKWREIKAEVDRLLEEGSRRSNARQ